MWNIHYNVLKEHVDEFVVVSFDKTFSGTSRPVELLDLGTYPKLRTHAVHCESLYEKYREMAEQSPNAKGADHWKLEFLQKESIKSALTYLKDDDVVFIGDCDEIWDPEREYHLGEPSKLLLKVYTYYLNNRSSEIFRGTLVGFYKDIKDKCLNHLRSDTKLTQLGGWHFTSMGGPEALRKKLTDSYTEESYATPYVLESLESNLQNNKDFLGRDFTYTLDETEWPEFLKSNKAKYQHLCR